MVVMGLGIIALGFYLFEQDCRGGLIDTGWCPIVSNSPPWSLLAAFATAPALLLTWYWKDAHKRKDIAIAQTGQVTERFTRAIEHLGSDKMAIRLGAIYALERIAKDSPEDRWTIVETLSAFVRMSAPLKMSEGVDESEKVSEAPEPPTDLQAALTVLGRRAPPIDPVGERIDLSKTDLSGVDLSEADFRGVNFGMARLAHANLSGTQLGGAVMAWANLESAWLTGANLEKIVFMETHLERATLLGANLEGAVFFRTHLEGANLESVLGLKRGQLKGGVLLDHATALPSGFEDMIPPAPKDN